MSSVRMCDRCGAVFSELADGWQTFTGATFKNDEESGRRVSVNVAMDACPDCAGAMRPAPVLSPHAGGDRFFETEELKQRAERAEARLRELEAGPQPAQPVTPVEDAATT